MGAGPVCRAGPSRPNVARRLQASFTSTVAAATDRGDAAVPSPPAEAWPHEHEALMASFDLADSQDSAAPPRKVRRTSILRKPIPCGHAGL